MYYRKELPEDSGEKEKEMKKKTSKTRMPIAKLFTLHVNVTRITIAKLFALHANLTRITIAKLFALHANVTRMTVAKVFALHANAKKKGKNYFAYNQFSILNLLQIKILQNK